ncbi:interferon alpha-inducible protein 27-like protein 2A [Mesocricetus auratus]|uniref:Interferon alpha-inducible protein 27-like protein 2A n=1 Tax=Mesocricetus auratus TaxID=10036 RepID=A0A3Q0CPB6_MESAU|nr:interferon alpha-inducible protein 27-like protein 2A [Mesocricetus auratus]
MKKRTIVSAAIGGEDKDPPFRTFRKLLSGSTSEPIPLTPLPRAGALIAAPIALGALGFTGAGIAAGSIAAKMMSAAAIANGGGVAAGSLVATLQSVGVVGLSTSANIILGSVGAAIGASVEEAIDSWTDQENQEETVDTKMIVQITQ